MLQIYSALQKLEEKLKTIDGERYILPVIYQNKLCRIKEVSSAMRRIDMFLISAVAFKFTDRPDTYSFYEDEQIRITGADPEMFPVIDQALENEQREYVTIELDAPRYSNYSHAVMQLKGEK